MRTVLSATDVVVSREGKNILGPLEWTVNEGERWVILGPNGAGKSTLLLLCATAIHPTSGSMHILEEELGRVDVFELRTRLGLTTPALLAEIPFDERVMDVVLTAAYAITGRWQEITNEVARILNSQGAVFILWGKSAGELSSVTNPERTITGVHPSPLSAYRGFFGSKPFSKTNELLRKTGQTEIIW